MPLDQLSSLMEAHFPCEMEPQEYIQDVLIDPHGYVDLAHTTYTNIVSTKEEYEKLLSEAEFVQACGWLFAYRILKVRNSVLPVELNGFVELLYAMQSLPDIPEPIAQYLEGIGLYRDAHGQTLCPEYVMSENIQHERGLHPSLIEDYTQATPQYLGSLFPFAIYERTMLMQGPQHANFPNALRTLDIRNIGVPAPGAPVPALDPYFQRVSKLPFVPPRAPHRARVPNMIGAPCTANLNLLIQIRWDTEVFTDFCMFCQRIQKHMSTVAFPKSTAGSPAMTTASVPEGPGDARPDHYEFQAFQGLTKSEQHASRLFRYRYFRPSAAFFPDPNQAQYNAAFERAPHQLTGPAPLSLTTVRSHRIYLQYYVSKFVKQQT